jgi:hypothetical protein
LRAIAEPFLARAGPVLNAVAPDPRTVVKGMESSKSPDWPPGECDIIAGFLNWLNSDGKSLKVSDRPDDHDQHGKTCDYICVDTTKGTEIAVELITLWREEDACREDKLWLKFIHEIESELNGKVTGTYHVYSPMDDMSGIDTGDFSRELSRFLATQRLSENDTVIFRFQGLDWRIHKFLDSDSKVEFARYGAPGEDLANDDVRWRWTTWTSSPASPLISPIRDR